jgi:hypothetical protein
MDRFTDLHQQQILMGTIPSICQRLETLQSALIAEDDWPQHQLPFFTFTNFMVTGGEMNLQWSCKNGAPEGIHIRRLDCLMNTDNFA